MSAGPTFEELAYMERAIAAMRKSVPDRKRLDGKTCPCVGAVIVDADGKYIGEAHRGELREGDHAEFTLLERKNRSVNFSGATLYATLEPCAPGARKPPKLSCAERIVNARIKKVWIGIDDPDPTVDSKGINYLKEHGVEVDLFPPELQEEIYKANRDFIEGANARRNAPKEEALPSGDPLAQMVKTANFNDLSTVEILKFSQGLGLRGSVDSKEVIDTLIHLTILERTNEGLIPTRYGILLFGKKPREFIPEAGVMASVVDNVGKRSLLDFDGPIAEIPSKAMDWLKTHVPNFIVRTSAVRSEVNNDFFEVAREGLVNALVHRNYNIEGTKCHFDLTPNELIIKSPGIPHAPISLDSLQAFHASMKSQNPKIHFVFSKLGIAEERGLGMKSFKEAAKSETKAPRFTQEGPYLVLTIPRPQGNPDQFTGHAPDQADEVGTRSTDHGLTEIQQTGLDWLRSVKSASTNEYAAGIDIHPRSARKHFVRFIELGLVEKTGTGPGTRYTLIR